MNKVVELCSLTGLAEIRGLSLNQAKEEIVALVDRGFEFCEKNLFFYKKEDGGDILILLPCKEHEEFASYESVAVRIVDGKIVILTLVDDESPEELVIPDNIRSVSTILKFLSLSADIHDGKIIGLEFNF